MDRNRVKIIAEIGWNFMGDMLLAEKMIASAKKSGADMVKFQYWNPDRLRPGVWDNDGRRQIYEKAKLNKEKIIFLTNLCKTYQINFLISAFNVADAKFIKDIGIDSIKIPSHEVANYELHKFCSTQFQKCYVSLGAGTQQEVLKTAEIYNLSGKNNFWVGMHCVSSYPCPTDKSNLPRIKFINDICTYTGYSDHTSDLISPVVAVALGASVIEKHFTIDKNLPGRDNKFALDEKEFSEMVKNIRLAESSLIYHGDGCMDIEMDTINNYRGRWGDNF